MNKLLDMKRRATEIREQMIALNESAGSEERDLTEDEQTQWDAWQAELGRLSGQIERQEALNTIPTIKPDTDQRQTPERPKPPPTKRTPDDVNSLFCRYIRQKPGIDDPYLAAEYKQAAIEERASNDTTMNITTAADGGNLVPAGHYQGIIERARPVALPFLLDVMPIPGKGTTVSVPTDNEADTGVFVSTAESGAFDRDAPAIGNVDLTLVKYTKKVDLTYELLEDEDSRLMDFLNFYVGKGYAATLNSLMVTEALANGTAALTLDSATVIAASEIPELFYKLSAEYARGNLAWLVARAVEGEIYSLASANMYTFAGNPQGGIGRTPFLWGVPLYTDAGMGATEASAKSMLIADWSYMGMRLEPEMTFLRDPYTRSSSGEVILNYYFRCDFGVLQAAAFQYATHPTA